MIVPVEVCDDNLMHLSNIRFNNLTMYHNIISEWAYGVGDGNDHGCCEIPEAIKGVHSPEISVPRQVLLTYRKPLRDDVDKQIIQFHSFI